MKFFKNTISLIWISVFLIGLTVNTVNAGDSNYSLTLEPVKQVTVKGDVNKFRAHHWMDDDYSGGIKNLSFDNEYDNDTLLSFEGHLIPNENDNGVSILLSNEDVGDFNFNYSSFRKYYDNSGGYFYPFSTLATNNLDKELELDIENLTFSFSPTFGDIHGITFLYEHHVKDGDKSRLSWSGVTEGSTTKDIAPSYQHIEEEVNVVALKGETTLSNFDVSAEQRYERMDTHTVRYEKWLSTNATASQSKQRFQDQRPEAEMYTTTLNGKRWFDDEKSFLGLAYRFNKLNATELENITETNAAGVPFNYSSAKTRVNATAENDMNDHTLVSHYMKLISPTFKVTAKLKNQILKRDGQSTYPYDASPSNAVPNGIIEATDYSVTKNSLMSFGQNFGFQYSGIKNTSIYGDVEIDEMFNDLKERQENISRVLSWERFTKTNTKKTVYTLGSRIVPSNKVNLTTQVRHRNENNDYDDKVDSASSLNSAFFDSLKVVGDEVTTKLTWKPLNWLQNSFRYQFDNKKYDSRVQNLIDTSVGRSITHTFTYDMFLEPVDNVLFNLSYSLQDAETTTPAASSSDVSALPGYNADVQSFLFSGSYTPTEEVSFISAFGYTFSDNFNDYTSNALPLGVSNNYYTVELGMNWTPKNKSFSVEPHYGYYNYNTTSTSEFGNYIAHIAWLDVNFEW